MPTVVRILARAGGGFHAHLTEPHMIGQMQILDVVDPAAARLRLLEQKARLLDLANQIDPVLIKFGGGARDRQMAALIKQYLPKAAAKGSPLIASNDAGKTNLADIILPKRDTAPLETAEAAQDDMEEISEDVAEAPKKKQVLAAKKANAAERLYRLMDGAAEALEFIVHDDPPYINVPLRELKVKPEALLAVIVREGQVRVPFGGDSLQPLDSVVVIVKGGVQTLGDIFR